MNRALYPGSFDPFTNGHLSVLDKAAKIFDEVVVAISTNPAKKRRFEQAESFYAIYKALEDKPYKDKVHLLITLDTIPARIAEDFKCNYIVRGIRNNMDYNYEEGLAQYNSEYNSNIETIYFRADDTAISSTMVYSFMKEKIDVNRYLPYDKNLLTFGFNEPSFDNYKNIREKQDFVMNYVAKEQKWLSELRENQE